MSNKWAGRCLCGQVSFNITGEPRMSAKCYCNDCRRASGAGHIAAIGVAEDDLTITGSLSEFTLTGDSGKNITRCFCPTCGSQVVTHGEAFPGMRMVRAALLDDPDQFTPQLCIYTSRAPAWDQPAPDAVMFDELPPAQN